MAIENDHSVEDVKTMKYELKKYEGLCSYDEIRKKIVYSNVEDALKVYCEIQLEEMEKHKWIESEKARTDLGCKKLKEWVERYSGKFRNYWTRTHIFVPVAL